MGRRDEKTGSFVSFFKAIGHEFLLTFIPRSTWGISVATQKRKVKCNEIETSFFKSSVDSVDCNMESEFNPVAGSREGAEKSFFVIPPLLYFHHVYDLSMCYS